MVNLFAELFDNNNATGTTPFAAIAEGSPATPADQEATIKGTAQLQALVEIGPDQQALLDSWETVVKKAEDTIRMSGDYSYRMAAAQRQKMQELNGLSEVLQFAPQMDPTGELAQGAVEAARQSMAIEDDKRAQYALEKEAMQKAQMLAATDPVQAELMLRNIESGGPLDIQREILTKRLLLSREVAKLEGDVEQRNALEWAADFVLGALPFRSGAIRTGNVDIDKPLRNWYDSVFAGQRQNLEVDSIMGSMPLEQFTEQLPELLKNIQSQADLLGYRNKAGELNVLRDFQTTPSALETNIWAGVDVAGLVPFGKVGKGASYIMRLGGRKQAIDMVVGDLVKGATDDVILQNSLPSSLMSTSALSNVGVGISVGNKLLKVDEMMAELPKLATRRFANEVEFSKAVDSAKAKLDNLGGNYAILDQRVEKNLLPDGTETYKVVGQFGKSDGLGFKSEATAKAAASKMGVTDAEVVQDTSGQWFVQVKRDVAETGFFDTDVSTKGTTNILSRLSLGSRHGLDEFTYGQAQLAGGARQRSLAVFKDEIKGSFGKLDSKELGDLDSVLQWGQENEKWLSKDQFNQLYNRQWGRTPREAEWKSYETYRKINDTEWVYRNSYEYKRRVAMGLETVDLEGPGFKITGENAKVHTDWSLAPNARVYDVTSGVLYNKVNKITDEVVSKLKNDGYVLVETERSVNVAQGSPARQFLIRQGDLKRSQLKWEQLGYAEGGHRFYKGRNFVKQASVKRLEDGSEFLDAPKAFVAGSRAETKAWADTANKLLDYFNNTKRGQIDGTTVDEMLDLIADGGVKIDLVKFMDDIKSGRVDPFTKFEAVGDRELPSQYLGRANEFAFNEDLSLSQGSGAMYYGSKGDQLRDYQNQLARTYDPYRAVNRSLQNIATLSSFGDFKLSSMSRWVETYRRLNALDFGSVHQGASDDFIFANAKILTSAPDRIRQVAEGQRDAIKRILNWKTEGDLAVEAMGARLAEFVAGDKPGLRDKFVTGARDYLQDNNPINFLRGWAFDTTLGMLNPAQLWVQGSTWMAITSMNLRGGLFGAMSTLPVKGFMLNKGSKELLDHYVKTGVHRLMGFENPDEFRLFMNSIRNSGILDIGHGHTMIGDYGGNVVGGAFGKLEDLREKGRVLFNFAEQSNLTAAYRSAWLDISEALPDLDKTSREFAEKVYTKAMDYSFGMQRESQAAWQRGLMSLPTQFFSYNARMLEALLSGTFTREQRARLAVGQLFLYGTAGIPLASLVTDAFKNKEGKAPEPGTAGYVFDRGMLDQFFYMITGYDVQMGSRLSSGEFVQNTVKDLFNASEYGSVSTADTLGGASFQIWAQGLGDLGDWIKYLGSESGEPGADAVSNSALQRLARNISTVDRTVKALTLMNYGTYTTRNGVTIVDDLPTTAGYAAMIAFGGSPGELEDIAASMAYKKNRDKAVAEAAKVLVNYRTDYLNQTDRRVEIREEINAFVGMLPPDIKKDVLRKANHESESLYKSITERVEKLRNQKEQAEDGQSPTKP